MHFDNTQRLTEIEARLAKLMQKVEQRAAKNTAARREITELKAEQRRLLIPAEPTPGTIIRFIKRWAGNPVRYTYVAHRDVDGGRWYGSGRTFPNGATWPQLVEFIRADNVEPFAIEVVTTSRSPLRSPC